MMALPCRWETELTAKNEAEQEADARSDTHRLEGILTDVALGITLKGLSLGVHLIQSDLYLALVGLGSRLGLGTQIIIRGGSRVAQILGSSGKVFLTGNVGSLCVFLHGFSDHFPCLGGSFQSLLGMLSSALQFLCSFF